MSEITGILDNSTEHVLVLTDDRIILRGNVKIHGVLDVGLVRTTEIIADSRYEKKFLSFAAPEGTQLAGTGLLWVDSVQNKQLVYRNHPDRFFLSEHVELPSGKAFLIEGNPILSEEELGSSVTKSNLRSVGTLENLSVNGNVNLSDTVFFNSSSRKLSINNPDGSGLFSVYDDISDVEVIIEGSESGRGKIGTYNNKGLEIVTGNQTRITVTTTGNIILGQEQKDSTVISLYGKVGVNVKNPDQSLVVAGNIKFADKLFATGTEPPAEGNYQKGDIVWNSDPLPSKYVGWVCTAAGNPGIWSPFGLILGQ
jgi:hypothetical protein